MSINPRLFSISDNRTLPFVWKQKGTVRMSSSERSLHWRERAKERTRNHYQAVECEEASIEVSSSAFREREGEKLKKKDEKRIIRKCRSLKKRFSLLPRFLKDSLLNDEYQRLYEKALKRISDPKEETIRGVSQILVRMNALRASERKRTTARQCASKRIIEDPHWNISLDLSREEFKDELVAHTITSAVIIWMTPRSVLVTKRKVARHVRNMLDGALRRENDRRRRKGIRFLKDRNRVVIAGKRGSYWRRLSADSVQKAIVMCEDQLRWFTPRGALSLLEFKKAFGLSCKDGDVAGLGSRQFSAAQALLALRSTEESGVLDQVA